MKKNVLKFKKGFTLIETLVAISILTAAITGPLVMSIKNIGTANTSQDQLVAFYLGQEVVEYVRNVRDTNLIGKDLDAETFDWLAGLSPCIPTAGDLNKTCQIDVVTGNICEIGVGCSGKLNFIDKGYYGYYGYDSGEGSSFTRTVQIKEPIDGNKDEAQVNVKMTWKSKYGKKIKEMNLQDHIFNWRK